MGFIEWIEIIVVFKIIEEFVEELGNAAMHVSPKTFYSLVVD